MDKKQFKNLLPEFLQENIKLKSCGFFIGAGISMKQPSGLPGWTDLLSNFIDFAEKNHKLNTNIIEQLNVSLENGKLLEVAEFLQGNLKSDYTRFLVDTFDNHKVKPNENHDLLALIESPLFITTNYDTLLENTIIGNGERPIVSTSKSSNKLELIHKLSIRKKILKIHGDITESESLVLSESDYMETLDNPMLNVILKSYFHRHSFIFLGCSMTDPDVLMFLKQIKLIFKGYSPTHYALIKRSESNNIDEYIYSTIYNIEFIYIDNHDDTTDFLNHAIELQKESQSENTLEKGIKELYKLNYVEFLLQTLEMFNEHQEFYYSDLTNYDKDLITEDLDFNRNLRGIFEDFRKMDLCKLISYPSIDFKQVYDNVNSMEVDLVALTNNPSQIQKSVLCDLLNDKKDNLIEFTNDLKNYIRYRRIIITDKLIKDELNVNQLMLEVYEGNYIK